MNRGNVVLWCLVCGGGMCAWRKRQSGCQRTGAVWSGMESYFLLLFPLLRQSMPTLRSNGERSTDGKSTGTGFPVLSQRSGDGEVGAAADEDFKNGGECCTAFHRAFFPLSFRASISQGDGQGLFLMTEEREGATLADRPPWSNWGSRQPEIVTGKREYVE